jgi:hypothetical protein
MSVTSPTLNFPPLDDELELLVALALLELGAAAPPLLELLLLLLLPHAASTRATTAVARTASPRPLILPVTTSPFLRTESDTIFLTVDAVQSS